MKSRRTASAEFPLQPSSDHVKHPSRRKTHHQFVAASSRCPATIVTETGYTINNTTSSAPARLQRDREDASHRLPPTSPTYRSPPTSPHRRRRSHHCRRSNHEAHQVSTIPYRPHLELGADENRLGAASLDPPITKETLSELDLNRIVNDIRLRHDINFEHEIMFRPNARRGALKKREDNEYFEALATEFDYYIRRQKGLLSSATQPDHKRSPVVHSAPSSFPNFPQRLPPMISAIGEVIKTLVPTAKWETVDDQFDVDLRMQELEHGICNIAGLFEWIGQLLLCSCSPMRDAMVTAMVAKSQQAVTEEDAHQLVDSVKDLFGILETMKLDVTNHQIRYLRLYLLEESVQFEQHQILDRIAAGWSISHERRWFEAPYAHPETQDRFVMFKERVIDRIVTPTATFPLTLASDLERLKHLQNDFRLCHYHLACGHTFRETLSKLGWTKAMPMLPYTECMKHIGAIIGAQGQDFEFGAHSDVVLEIVRVAFRVCGIKALPDPSTLALAGWYLGEALDPQTAFYNDIEGILWDELSTMVHLEVEAIFHMNPLEILNRYDPGPPGLSKKQHRGGDLSLQSISKRAAHIIVLHWRVWAPILYDQPDPESPRLRNPTIVTEAEEMAARTRTHRSLSSVNGSQPILMQSRDRRRAHTTSLSRGNNRSEAPIYTPGSSDGESTTSERPERSNAPSA